MPEAARELSESGAKNSETENRPLSSDSISATLTLYQGSTEIDSWSNSGYFCV